MRLRLSYVEQPPIDIIREQSANTKIYWDQWPRFVVKEDVVYRVSFDRRGRPVGLHGILCVCETS